MSDIYDEYIDKICEALGIKRDLQLFEKLDLYNILNDLLDQYC